MKRCSIACLAALTALAVSSAGAETPRVYMGITAAELAAFLVRDGWTANEPVTPERRTFSFRSKTKPGSLYIELRGCDAAHRCSRGSLRQATYLFVSPQFAWHWNHRNKGAVAYGASYLTLERPLHFRGVTELYLREVMLEIWPRVQAQFLKDGEAAWNADRRLRREGEPKQ